MNDIPTSDEIDVERRIKCINLLLKGETVKQVVLVNESPYSKINKIYLQDPYKALEYAKQYNGFYVRWICCKITKKEKAKYFKGWK